MKVLMTYSVNTAGKCFMATRNNRKARIAFGK